MIKRYSNPEMEKIWSDENKYNLWFEIEIAACEAWEKRGKIPKPALEKIKKNSSWNLKRIEEIEEEVKHDVLAFVTSMSETVGEDGRYIHMGMTSSDVLDTAFACQLVEAGNLIDNHLKNLISILEKQANQYKDLPIMGRSHGIYAQPTSVGIKFAHFGSEFIRHRKRLEMAIEDISVGKLSGAVGTYAHLSPDMEEEVLKKLGLKPETVSTQVVQRDRHAFYFCVLAGVASTIEKVATEIRHLQRTEVGEMAEPFGSRQKGSSAMPHKRNPILCENLTGLARLIRNYSISALENVSLWHERDISHSSVERVISPDATIALDYALRRLIGVIEGIDVFPEKITENIEKSYGLYASQDLLVALTQKGWDREKAYRFIQKKSFSAMETKTSLEELCLKDSELKNILSEKEIKELFNLKRHIKWSETIVNRAFK